MARRSYADSPLLPLENAYAADIRGYEVLTRVDRVKVTLPNRRSADAPGLLRRYWQHKHKGKFLGWFIIGRYVPVNATTPAQRRTAEQSVILGNVPGKASGALPAAAAVNRIVAAHQRRTIQGTPHCLVEVVPRAHYVQHITVPFSRSYGNPRTAYLSQHGNIFRLNLNAILMDGRPRPVGHYVRQELAPLVREGAMAAAAHHPTKATVEAGVTSLERELSLTEVEFAFDSLLFGPLHHDLVQKAVAGTRPHLTHYKDTVYYRRSQYRQKHADYLIRFYRKRLLLDPAVDEWRTAFRLEFNVGGRWLKARGLPYAAARELTLPALIETAAPSLRRLLKRFLRLADTWTLEDLLRQTSTGLPHTRIRNRQKYRQWLLDEVAAFIVDEARATAYYHTHWNTPP